MGILSWIGLGLVSGIIGKFFMPGRDGGGFIATTLLGIAGAVIGGFVATYFGFGKVSGFNPHSVFVASGGAFLLLFLYRMLKK